MSIEGQKECCPCFHEVMLGGILFSGNVEYSLNLSKTCYMTFFANTASHCNLIVNGQTIEKVNSYKYLKIITDDDLSGICISKISTKN